jgi:catechol 2,3-dioxygenase-like lactoylglutathione lyase family enzyme
MRVNANHHACIRVRDLERAADFYIEALGGRWLTRPFVQEGEYAQVVAGGPEGVRFRVAHIGFDEGGIELFQFTSPVHETDVVHPSRGNVLHYALQVDDVAAAVDRVIAAGGRMLWPEIREWGDAKVTYVADPDENVIELITASLEEVVEMTIAALPDSDPARVPG